MDDPIYATYKYKEWFFEVHSVHYGPWPLDEEGRPTEEPPGSEFWEMYEEFSKLDSKEVYRL